MNRPRRNLAPDPDEYCEDCRCWLDVVCVGCADRGQFLCRVCCCCEDDESDEVDQMDLLDDGE